jgi:hypothetical protein
MRPFIYLFATGMIGCAPVPQQTPKFGDSYDFDYSIGQLTPPEELVFDLYPSSEFYDATIVFTTSELDGEWSEVIAWNAVADGGDGIQLTIHDPPESGWIAMHGWAESISGFQEPGQVCNIGEGIEYPAGHTDFDLSLSGVHPELYAQMNDAATRECFLIYRWYTDGGNMPNRAPRLEY